MNAYVQISVGKDAPLTRETGTPWPPSFKLGDVPVHINGSNQAEAADWCRNAARELTDYADALDAQQEAEVRDLIAARQEVAQVRAAHGIPHKVEHYHVHRTANDDLDPPCGRPAGDAGETCTLPEGHL